MRVNSFLSKKIHFLRLAYKQILFVWFSFFLIIALSIYLIRNIEHDRLAMNASRVLALAQANIDTDFYEPEILLSGASYTIRRMILNGESLEAVQEYIKDISDSISINISFNETDSLFVADKSSTTYMQRIFGNNGELLGIVRMFVPTDNIEKVVESATIIEGKGFGIMLDSHLVFIAHKTADLIGKPISKSPLANLEKDLRQGKDLHEIEIPDYEGSPFVFFSKRLKNGWHLGTMIPKRDYYKPVNDMVFSLSVSGFLLALILSFIFMRIIEMKNKADLRTLMMLDSAPLCATFWDKNLQIIDCNQEAIKLFDLPNKRDFMNKFYELSPMYQPDGIPSRDKIVKALNKTFEEGYQRIEWMHRTLGGDPIPTEVTLIRLESDYNNEFIILGYTKDLRELKAMIKEMRRIEIAEESSKAKSKFLATMSHEIRTPMNAILGIAEIQLQNENLPQNTKEAIERIYNSSHVLLGIINDILDLSKIEAGKMEIIPAEYEVASLINDTVQLNTLRIGSKLIAFDIHIDENIPFVLLGDGLRIKQILNNLLSNAFKYTKEGAVSLSAFAEPDRHSNGNTVLTFRVSDTGQGMSTEQVSMIFEEYSRFNLKENRETEGAGLGMNITKRLVEMMKGTISVESKPGEGSTFTVSLPQGVTGGRLLGKELAEKLQNFRAGKIKLNRTQITRKYMPYGKILIVDDVETNLYVAKGLMISYGLSIEVAMSGFEAIDKIKLGKKYDIIFMDHMMPKMDGVEAVKKIRKMGYSSPIVALTANAVAGQAEMFLQNGFDDYISKPIDTRQLDTILNRLIRDKQSEKSSETKQFYNYNEIELFSIFARDAKKSVEILESMYETITKESKNENIDLQPYIINTHSMKSALANIGEKELSGFAYELEQAGRKQDVAMITSLTPKFLNELRNVIEKVTPAEENDIHESDPDPEFLQKKLRIIQISCETYNKKAAKEALTELKQKSWSRPTKNLLDTLSELLLYGDFDKAAEKAKGFNS